MPEIKRDDSETTQDVESEQVGESKVKLMCRDLLDDLICLLEYTHLAAPSCRV